MPSPLRLSLAVRRLQAEKLTFSGTQMNENAMIELEWTDYVQPEQRIIVRTTARQSIERW